MRSLRFIGVLVVVLSVFVLTGFMTSQSDQITRPKLKEMLVELGYEVSDVVKDAGKEKYAVTFVKSELNIPLGFEISPSNSYVWLTVNLGEAPKTASEKCLTLLKQNGKVQPTFFYITESGRLMAALAVENRGLTNAILRTRAETITDNVGKTKEFWQATQE